MVERLAQRDQLTNLTQPMSAVRSKVTSANSCKFSKSALNPNSLLQTCCSHYVIVWI